MTNAPKTGKNFIDREVAPIKFFQKNFSPAKCANPENAKAAQALGFRSVGPVWTQLWGQRGYGRAGGLRQERSNFFFLIFEKDFSIGRNSGKTLFDAFFPPKKVYWRPIYGEKIFSGFAGGA